MWEKLVLNLLSNAFKFTFEGEIAADNERCEPAVAELVIQDTGVGVPKDELPRLFERFHRVEGQKSRSFGRLGNWSCAGSRTGQVARRHDQGERRLAGERGLRSRYPSAQSIYRPKEFVLNRCAPAHFPRRRLCREALRWLPEVNLQDSVVVDRHEEGDHLLLDIRRRKFRFWWRTTTQTCATMRAERARACCKSARHSFRDPLHRRARKPDAFPGRANWNPTWTSGCA